MAAPLFFVAANNKARRYRHIFAASAKAAILKHLVVITGRVRTVQSDLLLRRICM